MSKLLRTDRVLLLVLLLGVFAMSARNLSDPDVWWHLKTGQYIAEHKSVPHSDPFSYTRAGQPWVAHEWLSELLMYELYRAARWSGLIIFFAAVTSAALFVLYLRCGRNHLIACIATLFSAFAAQVVWGVRPQMLSFFLASLWLLILENAERRAAIAWWTLPLMLLWVNLHAGFALGLVLSTLSLAAGGIEVWWQHQDAQKLRLPAFILLLDILVVICNPNGVRMYIYPFATLRSAAMQSFISEWFSPNFHRAQYWPLLLTVLAVPAVLACSRAGVRLRDLLFLMVSLYGSLCFIRMIPFFVLIAVPVILRSLRSLICTSSPKVHLWSVGRACGNAVILLSAVIFAGLRTWQVIEYQSVAEVKEFPSRAVAYLKAHPPSGPVFNHYDWGGYLIWNFGSRLPVFIDGRADIYGETFLNDFVATYEFSNGWQAHLERWKVATVLVPPDSPLAQGLRLSPSWKVSYEDPQAVVLASSESQKQGSPLQLP